MCSSWKTSKSFACRLDERSSIVERVGSASILGCASGFSHGPFIDLIKNPFEWILGSLSQRCRILLHGVTTLSRYLDVSVLCDVDR